MSEDGTPREASTSKNQKSETDVNDSSVEKHDNFCDDVNSPYLVNYLYMFEDAIYIHQKTPCIVECNSIHLPCN